MGTWTSDELDRIGEAEELEIESVRDDGTRRAPVTIWVVRQRDDLYVRSVKGREASWFRGVQTRHEAHIEAGGVSKDVLVVETDDLSGEIDAVYRAKYRRYPDDVAPIVAPAARAATLKLVPH